VRVAQAWAGKRWGAFFWPRIGQEVLVNFVEGDPDHPILVGSVYNAEQMPPYLGSGPDTEHGHDPNLAGIKTCSTPGGDGYNELRFDDSKNEEQIFLHAQRDLDVRVRHDGRERIGHDRDIIVGREKDGQHEGDQRELIHRDLHQKVLGDRREYVRGNYELRVGPGPDANTGDLSVQIDRNRVQHILKDDHLHVEASRVVSVDGNLALTAGAMATTVRKDLDQIVKGNCRDRVAGQRDVETTGTLHELAGADAHRLVLGECHQTVEGTHLLTANLDRHDHVGTLYALTAGQELHVKAGLNVVIEAGATLTIKGPGGFISIGQDGVTIQGRLVKINSGGAPGVGSEAKPTASFSITSPREAARAHNPQIAMPETAQVADDSRSGYPSTGRGKSAAAG
jgi:type VI secretion system secreted protein VgrG